MAGRFFDEWQVGEQFVERRQRLRHDRAHRDDRRFGIGAGFAQPVSAGERIGLPAVVAAFGLRDRSGRQAKIGRLAIGVVDQAERFLHHDRELVDEGGFAMTQPRLTERN